MIEEAKVKAATQRQEYKNKNESDRKCNPSQTEKNHKTPPGTKHVLNGTCRGDKETSKSKPGKLKISNVGKNRISEKFTQEDLF